MNISLKIIGLSKTKPKPVFVPWNYSHTGVYKLIWDAIPCIHKCSHGEAKHITRFISKECAFKIRSIIQWLDLKCDYEWNKKIAANRIQHNMQFLGIKDLNEYKEFLRNPSMP